MIDYSKNKINKINTILSLILGISFFLLNLGISIFYILSFFFLIYYSFKNTINIDFLQKIFLSFLVYLFCANFFKNPSEINLDFFFENLLLFKFFLLFLFLDVLIKDIKYIKKIITINFFILIFLIFEVYLQRIIGFDLFGYSIHPYNRVTGPYNEELVIGTLILYIGFHSFFYFLMDKKFNSKINEFIFFVLFFNVYFFSIYLTGERMNFLMSLLIIFMMFVFLQKHRKKILFSFLIFISLIYSTFHFNFHVSKKYETLLQIVNLDISKMITENSQKSSNYKAKKDKSNLNVYEDAEDIKKNNSLEIHLSHFIVGIEIWKDYKIFGSGVKSFRKICGDYNNFKLFLKDKSCSTHPHNYLVELLVETGLFGIAFFAVFIFLIFKKNSQSLLFFLKKPENNLFIISFLIISISLIWPLKTSGRLFSNFYGSIFFFNIFTFYILLKSSKIKKKIL